MRAACGAMVGLLLTGASVRAQGFAFTPRLQGQLRAEAVAGTEPTVLAGAGFNVPAGYYVRIDGWAAAGRVSEPGSGHVARAALAGRFLVDPFHEARWGPYAGGGVAMDWRRGGVSRASLLLLVGTDFPRRGAWQPAAELGIGGGVRMALVLRAARRNGR